MERRSGWIWRGAEIYLVIVAVTALALAGWLIRYWNRGELSYLSILPLFAGRLRDFVGKHGLHDLAETAATVFWVFGPIVFPIIAIGTGVVLAFVRKRRRWAFVVALVVAALALVFVGGGIQALHGLESPHFYKRSPYVHEYKLFIGPLAISSAAFLIGAVVAGIVRARRPTA